MAVKYYPDGTYTKGDGKLYYGNVEVGTDKSTNVSKAGNNSTKSSSSSSSSKKSSSTSKSSGSSSNRYNTTVTESNGNTSNGYIEDGRSYYSDGTPINAGASVTDAQGNTWTKGGTSSTSNNAQSEIDMINAAIRANNSDSNSSSYKPNYGTVSTENITYNPYEEAYRESERRRQELESQIKEQNKLAVEQGTNRLNAQKANINQAAEDNARQAYIMHMQAQKALPQQLASQGASGGATETANLGLSTTYQNNVNAINQNKANAIQEIDNAIVDLKNTGDLATVEQVLANNQAALDAYMANFDKGVAYNQWANQYNANRADVAYDKSYQERAYADMLKQQAIENAYREKEFNLDKQQANKSAQEKAEKEATQIYDDVYKEAKKRWETDGVDAATLDNWLAQQNITDTEYEAILEELGIKTILDNLYRLGKLS